MNDLRFPNLSKLLLENPFTNCELVFADESILVSKTILAASCDYFYNLFFSEIIKSKFHIENISLEEFETFYTFIHEWDNFLINDKNIEILSNIQNKLNSSALELKIKICKKDFAKADKFQDNLEIYTTLKGQRQVVLDKQNACQGFTIIGGVHGVPIYVSKLNPGSIDSLSNIINVGDRLMSVNKIPLTFCSHEVAIQAIKNAKLPVTLTLCYKPIELSNITKYLATKTDKSTNGVKAFQHDITSCQFNGDYYVKALFDHKIIKLEDDFVKQLPFQYGSIIHIKNSNNDKFWIADLLGKDEEVVTKGLILPQEQAEKEIKGIVPPKNTNANRKSDFMSQTESRESTQITFSKKFPFITSVSKYNNLSKKEEAQNNINEVIFTYQKVIKITVDYIRPIVILGAMKNEIANYLVSNYIQKFILCKQHTSQVPLENGLNAITYNFVSNEEMLQKIRNNIFIDCDLVDNNLYGTSKYTLNEAIESGKHGILNISGKGVKYLHDINIHPIVFYIKTEDWQQISKNDINISETEARAMLYESTQVEHKFKDIFTTIIKLKSFKEMITNILEEIQNNSKDEIWVPSD